MRKFKPLKNNLVSSLGLGAFLLWTPRIWTAPVTNPQALYEASPATGVFEFRQFSRSMGELRQQLGDDFLIFQFTLSDVEVFHSCVLVDIQTGPLVCQVLGPRISLEKFRSLILRLGKQVEKNADVTFLASISGFFSKSTDARELADLNLVLRRVWGQRLLNPSDEIQIVVRSGEAILPQMPKAYSAKTYRKVEITNQIKQLISQAFHGGEKFLPSENL